MNFLLSRMTKYRLTTLIKELNELNYNEIIDGVTLLMKEFNTNDKNDEYLKALYAIRECMIKLKEIYQPELISKEGN